MSLLEKINNPSDLKKLHIDELPRLATEIRELIISVAENNGGHLASSLGAVDAIIALYYVFDFPKDKLVFDVGHQAYAHKILTERRETFELIRTSGGLSGFPNIFESEYDAFSVGHAGTSLAASIGYATARDRLEEDYYVICFVGDGSFFNGENLEALFSLENKPQKLLIVLNDNGMSISRNKNSLYKTLSKMTMKKRYSSFMFGLDKLLGWNFIGRFLKRFKFNIKRSLDGLTVLDAVGIKYVGAFDGHNIKLLIKLLTNFKANPRTTLLHIKTTKGKGYLPAEDSAELFHGIGKHLQISVNSFSLAAGSILTELAQNDKKIVSITAGMTSGTGMSVFLNHFPDRYFDVGISEEFAVTFAAGLARAGMKPFVCIYSTFMQRSYDQIMMDVCLQNLPVVFLLDRAGFVGVDGATHQGLFDLSYLRSIPNITILCPKDEIELADMINYAIGLNAPTAIRYPNGISENFDNHLPLNNGLWEEVRLGETRCIFAVGSRMLRIAIAAAEELGDCAVINARSVKPLDEEVLLKYKGSKLAVLEENTAIGGFASAVLEFYNSQDITSSMKIFAAKDAFVVHASVSEQLAESGITVQAVVNALK